MGSIYRRGKTYWIKWYRDSKAFYESSGSTNAADAKRLLQLREGDVARGVPVAPKVGRLTFSEAAQDAINEYRANDRKTTAFFERRIRLHLAPFFGGFRMAAITTADVHKYIARRQQEGSSNANLNRELSVLQKMFTLAVRAGKLVTKPYIPALQERNVRQGFFEADQLDAVCEQLKAELQVPVRFAAITGWRIRSEVLPLTWRLVDFKAGTVNLNPHTTKNEDARTFPFSRELRRLLEQQRKWVSELEREHGKVIPWVFPRPTGERIKDFYKAWCGATKRAGVPGRVLHDSRRTAVRALVRAGIPEAVAMKMTGHRTRTVFERYNIVSPGDLQEAAAKLDAAVTRPRKVREN